MGHPSWCTPRSPTSFSARSRRRTRSSATAITPWRCARARAEDSQEASFAGQQETYLHVRGAAEVLDRVRDCWASFFSERALFYPRAARLARRPRDGRRGAAHGGRRRPGSSSRWTRSSAAATAWSSSRCSGWARRSSGQVTPDHFVLARDGSVKRERLAVQPLAVEARSEGGTVERELSPHEGGAASLGANELRELRGSAPSSRKARRSPGHRMGTRGRRALRAPVPAGDGVSDHDLVERAQRWMAERHPHFDHMQRALDWALVLDPEASDAVRIAAVTHDAERAYPDPDSPWDSAVSWADPEYNRWHQERCAHRRRMAARAGSRGGADRGGRAARQRARGGRLARGRHRAGGRLALLPRDDGLDPRRVDPVRPLLA